MMYSSRYLKQHVLLAGMCFSKSSKLPHMNSFLIPIIREINQLYMTGIIHMSRVK